jgi:hypothetical protein
LPSLPDKNVLFFKGLVYLSHCKLDGIVKIEFREWVIPACQRLRQHSAYVAAESLAMAGSSTAGRNLIFSACYAGMISRFQPS